MRQWLLIYETKGTTPQLQAFVEMADRQLGELARQRDELASTIDDLRSMRDEAWRLADGDST